MLGGISVAVRVSLDVKAGYSFGGLLLRVGESSLNFEASFEVEQLRVQCDRESNKIKTADGQQMTGNSQQVICLFGEGWLGIGKARGISGRR